MSLQLENEFVLLCQGYTSDENDKSATIFKTITDFGFSFDRDEFREAFSVEPGERVALPVEYTLTSSWFMRAKPKQNTPLLLTVKLLGPDSEVLYETSDDTFEVIKDLRRVRFTSRTRGLTVTESGLYAYHLTVSDHDGNQLGEGTYSFDVNLNFTKKKKSSAKKTV